jgi:hypothetical protein
VPSTISSVPIRQELKAIFVQQVKDLEANEDLADFTLVHNTKKALLEGFF